MDRVNLILNNDKFKSYLYKNIYAEEKRLFCKHDLQHFLDVARIAYIHVLELSLNISKDIVYAAGLLHDIGKWKQYESKIPHNETSAELAKDILIESNYTLSEIEAVISAIFNHRNSNNKIGTFEHIIYISDKASRMCFCCDACSECNWTEEKKNYLVSY